jgi:hypothetical protein
MKALFLFVLSSFFSAVIFAQTITWSPDLVKPKETETNSMLTFPGTDDKNYYANESVNGTRLIKRKWKDFFKTVDKSSLKLVKETDLTGELPDDGKDYLNARNFIYNNRQYNFFIDMNDQKQYQVYSVIQNMDGSTASSIKAIQKIDIQKFTVFKSSASVIKHKTSDKMEAAIASSYVNFKPAYDHKSIISALVYEKVDDDFSMLNISEWDENLKAVVSNNYKIPFLAKQYKEKTIFGDAGTAIGDQPEILDYAKDNNGFVYVLVQSANPADKDEANIFWLYQFKLSDPSYVKLYKKEMGKTRTSREAMLFQDHSGKIFVSSIGLEIEDDKDKKDRHRVNSAFIGSFSNEGNLMTIFSGMLKTDMMYNFAKEKQVDKDGYINSLSIKNILTAADGGCFVIWQHEWIEIKDNNAGNNTFTHIYYHSDNALVEYYNKGNKKVWEKAIYKEQKTSSKIANIYSDLASGILNNVLYVFYPDDPKNADKPVDEKDVTEYNVIKFGNKDLAGMFVAKFDAKGTYTRQYVKWPEDKIGFALCTNSFEYIGNNEVIGTVRKIKQGAMFLKSEEYTFFKLKF